MVKVAKSAQVSSGSDCVGTFVKSAQLSSGDVEVVAAASEGESFSQGEYVVSIAVWSDWEVESAGQWPTAQTKYVTYNFVTTMKSALTVMLLILQY